MLQLILSLHMLQPTLTSHMLQPTWLPLLCCSVPRWRSTKSWRRRPSPPRSRRQFRWTDVRSSRLHLLPPTSPGSYSVIVAVDGVALLSGYTAHPKTAVEVAAAAGASWGSQLRRSTCAAPVETWGAASCAFTGLSCGWRTSSHDDADGDDDDGCLPVPCSRRVVQSVCLYQALGGSASPWGCVMCMLYERWLARSSASWSPVAHQVVARGHARSSRAVQRHCRPALYLYGYIAMLPRATGRREEGSEGSPPPLTSQVKRRFWVSCWVRASERRHNISGGHNGGQEPPGTEWGRPERIYWPWM